MTRLLTSFEPLATSTLQEEQHKGSDRISTIKLDLSQSLMVQKGTPNLNVTLKGYTRKFWGLLDKVAHKTHQMTVENSSSLFFQISCSQGILNSSRLSCYLLLRLVVYMYLSQLMRTFTNYLKCIVISS